MEWKERHRLLKFFYDAYFDDKRESEYREDEIADQLIPSMNRKGLKIYLIEFIENKWIEQYKRPDAYKITNKGIVRVGYNKFKNDHISNILDKFQYWILILASACAISYLCMDILSAILRLFGVHSCN